MKIKKTKVTSYIYIIVSLFLIIDFVGHKILLSNIKSNYQKDITILFYQITSQTNDMLSKLLYNYSSQKEILIKKHKIVKNYLENKKDIFNIDLQNIHKQINNNAKSPNRYNIYLANQDYIIKNTTYKPDLNFDLSFAKDVFEKHYNQNIIGVSSPLFERVAKSFFSFTDEYIVKDGIKKGVLQVSYNYQDSKEDIKKLQTLLKSHANILELKAYILVNSGLVINLILKDFQGSKIEKEEFKKNLDVITKIKQKLKDNKIYIQHISKDDQNMQQIYISIQNPIFKDTKIIYSILFDSNEYYEKIFNLRLFMLFITIIGIASIFIINRIKENETKLEFQENFLNSAMHEIKTPLSIITLNNELRVLEFGDDEYATEITSALKVLKNSYDDIYYISHNDIYDYEAEPIDLSKILKDRVEYFESIAYINNKMIKLNIDSDCRIDISKIEIQRLIDNNISNAIKYSYNDTVIEIKLNDNILEFISYGTIIKDTKRVFQKYYREHKVVGGYGLGLSIVKKIANKYKIEISVVSNEIDGTLFKYKLKCHQNISLE